MYMVNELELDQVVGGTHKLVQAIAAVAESEIVNCAVEKITQADSDAFQLVKFILEW